MGDEAHQGPLGEGGLSRGEREALDAWEAPALPPGFVERATARAVAAMAAPRGRRRWPAFAAGAGVGALAAAAALLLVMAPREGADGATTMAIAGATLTCQGCEVGVAPMADEGATTMKAGTAGWIGAVSGAALTAAVLVSVYEGRVEARSANGERLDAGPGDEMVLRPDRAPMLRRGGAAAPPALAGPTDSGAPAGPAAAGAGRDATPAPAATLDRCREEATAATARVSQLQARVAELERSTRALQREAGTTRMYDLSQEELFEMAQHCELRWDMPPISLDGPQTVTRTAVTDLGLDDAQVAAINGVFTETNARLLRAVDALYREVMGDAPPSGMAPGAMLAEITDKTPRALVREVFQRLSAERAGLATPPGDLGALEPFERLLRLVTGVGDQLEREVAAKVGPETARALRDEHGGWGERSRSRSGCPGDSD